MLILNVDWADNALFHRRLLGSPYGRQEVARSVSLWAQAGINRVHWRVTYLGRVGYHSRLEKRIGQEMAQGGWMATNGLGELVEAYDPLAEGLKECRKAGMECFAWIDLFDEYWLGQCGQIITKYPRCQYVDRSGLLYFQGVPNYCYPEVCRHRLEQIEEVLQYEVDGIYLSLRSHANHWCQFHQEGLFGYNAPVVEEYRNRTGNDPTEIDGWKATGWPKNKMLYDGPPADERLLWDIQGTFMTSFLRSVRALCKTYGKQLVVDIGTAPQDGVPPIGLAKFTYQVDSWFGENIVDGVNVLLRLDGGWGRENYDSLPRELQKALAYRQLGAKTMYVWVNVNVESYGGKEGFNRLLERVQQEVFLTEFDGVCFHEAAALEFAAR